MISAPGRRRRWWGCSMPTTSAVQLSRLENCADGTTLRQFSSGVGSDIRVHHRYVAPLPIALRDLRRGTRLAPVAILVEVAQEAEHCLAVRGQARYDQHSH